MNLLSKDYSRCNNDDCHLKNKCNRFKQLQLDKEEVYVSKFKANAINICDFFIGN